MAKDDGGGLKALISKTQRQRRGGFPKELRDQVLQRAERRLAGGATVAAVAAELGISRHTLAYWRAQRSGSAPTIRRVKVVSGYPRVVHATVLGPCGIRIEGLTLDQLAELVRKLG